MPFNTFGGQVSHPADVSYRAVALSANVTLLWPSLAETATDVVANLMDVTPSAGSLSITMPDARQRSVGEQIIFRNLGGSSFTVKDATGGTISTVAPGVAIFTYLTSNATQAGSWGLVTFGTGTSAADASALAGLGLIAITTTLNQEHDVAETSSNVTIAASDRAKTYVWVSGTVTCTLPLSSSIGLGFFFIAKNAGAGTITFTPSGADTIDGAASYQLAPDEGAIFYSGAGSNKWYTVAKGRATAFAFTQLIKSVAGGMDVTLTSAEAANKVITFTGLITANINVIVPNTVSVYYVFNNTTGAFTLTVKTAAGTGVTVAQGTRDILVCDATNVNGAVTNTAIVTAFTSGSEASPSITFIGDTNTGFYLNAADKPAVTAGATDVMRWNTVASAVNAFDVFPSVTTLPVTLTAYGGDANVGIAVTALGTGTVLLGTGGGTQVTVAHVASSVNSISLQGAAAGNDPILQSIGSDTDVGLIVSSKGADSIRFLTAGATLEQFRILNTAAAVNFATLTGASTGNLPFVTASGTDTNIGLRFATKGTGAHVFQTGGGSEVTQVQITHTASAVNYLQFTGNATGSAPTITATGSDASVSLHLAAIGTSGAIRLITNGGTQVAVSGVSSTVNAVGLGGSATGVDIGVYAIGGDANINIRFTTEGTGSHRFFTNRSAGVEQVQITHTASAVNYLKLTGNITANGPTVSVDGEANVSLNLATKGTAAMRFWTNATAEQVRITHIASAVNYLSMTGAATGNNVSIQAAGSDTDVGLGLASKGADAVSLYTNGYPAGAEQVRVLHTAAANRYITLTGSDSANPAISTSAGSLAVGTNLVFSTDNTNDIGASGATRARTGYFGTSVMAPVHTRDSLGALQILGFDAIGVATGGVITVESGSGGTTSGSSGGISILTAGTTDGSTGAVTIETSSPTGTDRGSGAITLATGIPSGAGNAGAINFQTRNVPRLTIAGAGTFDITAASAVILNSTLSFTTATSQIIPGATSLALRNNGNSADNVLISNAGAVTIRDDLAVNGDTISTDDTTFNLLNATATTINFGSGASTVIQMGHISGDIIFAGATVVQNVQNGTYGLVAADANKHIEHTSGSAHTWTIPANSSVAYRVGTAISFHNGNAAGIVSIAITTDTMRLAGPGTTGTRSLAANGIATALKVATTEWVISGTGLT